MSKISLLEEANKKLYYAVEHRSMMDIEQAVSAIIEAASEVACERMRKFYVEVVTDQSKEMVSEPYMSIRQTEFSIDLMNVITLHSISGSMSDVQKADELTELFIQKHDKTELLKDLNRMFELSETAGLGEYEFDHFKRMKEKYYKPKK